MVDDYVVSTETETIVVQPQGYDGLIPFIEATARAAVAASVQPPSSITALGDSLTQGAGSTGGNAYPAQLATLIGREVRNYGIGGQTSLKIAMRQGGQPTRLTVANNQLVAGGNSVTAINGQAIVGMANAASINQLLSNPANDEAAAIPGFLGSIRGTLARAASGGPPSTAETYTFTPDAGSPLPVHVEPGTTFEVDLPAADAAIQVFWTGRNNIDNAAGIKADTAAMVAKLDHRRFVVLSVTNGANEGIGTSAYSSIVQVNSDLRATYPGHFIDVRSILIERGLGIAGIAPTGQDNADLAANIVPTSLRSDAIHFNNAGYGVVAKAVRDFILAKGW